MSNVFYNVDTAGAGSMPASWGKTATELLDPFLYIEDGWDFASVWGSPKAGGVPELRALSTQALYDNYLKVSGTLSRAYGDTGIFQGSLSTVTSGASVSVDVGSAISGTTNAGTYAWSEPNMVTLGLPGGLTMADFYLAFGTGGVTVTPRAVSLTGSRTYNGSTSFSASDIVLGNLANGETLTSAARPPSSTRMRTRISPLTPAGLRLAVARALPPTTRSRTRRWSLMSHGR
ncbi:hypothetical protein V6L77_00155 [Pannonibacter sp. Pt2-lr]